ncbi:MAG: formimidoylglutamate deiminase [Acidimicrobiales bacterium]|nr:formimidoylglutamate deiminase [Acidimicrobiales bacterium]
MTATSYAAAHAWLADGPAADVRLEVRDARLVRVEVGVPPSPGDERLPGMVFPGFADTHSHAFHRALRGRTHTGRGSFWTWRQTMYDVAARLDPDSLLALATAAFAEQALAGITVVGEFHYLHHRPDGRTYDDRNAMGEALREAASRAGVRLTLLDTCYLAGGFGQPTAGVQRRYDDGSATTWANRVAALADDDRTRIGVAIHSVRAVPAEALTAVANAFPDRPLHVHLSEQPEENAACRAAHGCTPTALLAAHGVLSPRTTAVHGTHLTDDDVALLAASGAGCCLCPSTEADLADGIGPARALADAGVALSLGTDQHSLVDLMAEARLLEMHERLTSLERGRFTVADLVAAATHHGYDALGWPGGGRLEVGAPADFVAVRLDTPRTAGALPTQVFLVAGVADVDTVVVGGDVVVREGRHVLGDVAALLGDAVDAVWQAVS